MYRNKKTKLKILLTKKNKLGLIKVYEYLKKNIFALIAVFIK